MGVQTGRTGPIRLIRKAQGHAFGWTEGAPLLLPLVEGGRVGSPEGVTLCCPGHEPHGAPPSSQRLGLAGLENRSGLQP